MDDYDKKLKENLKRNEKYIKEFEKWLNDKKLGKKTIKKHVLNAELYINDYLNYYEVTKMEDGVFDIYSFLNDWFIRKCLWSSKYYVKQTAASIKKFYQCMSEKGYVKETDYNDMCHDIKTNMDTFLDSMDEFDNICEESYDSFE